jgi:thiosulfate reductase cytochrome b subunit
MTKSKPSSKLIRLLISTGLSILVLSGMVYLSVNGFVFAKSLPTQTEQISPLHPTYPLLDEEGVNVLDSGGAVSTMSTCGACHNADFIASHSFHASAGLESFTNPGNVNNGRVWDTSAGIFGRWSPLTYRYLSPVGENPVDLTTPDWIMLFGAGHIGGGPTVYSRSGEKLTELIPNATDPESSHRDPVTGELIAWDWQESGVVEMNCFLCHSPQPNLEARAAALSKGEFRWASAATLVGTGLVEIQGDAYVYNPSAFAQDGELNQEFVQIQDPSNENCGTCHGVVHTDHDEPLVAVSCATEDLPAETTGQIISSQRITDSGLNLANKNSLTRSWDIHAERIVQCTDCHFSLNNPVYYEESADTRPEHLTFDPRRIDLGEYLYQPVHDFARGSSAQSTIAPELTDTMRRCESCHSFEATHNWLPYKERHMAELSCESCHIPKVYFTAIQQVDWTTLTTNQNPLVSYRGSEACNQTLFAETDSTNGDVLVSTASASSTQTLVTGYTPVLLPQMDVDGEQKLAPYNLVTSWFWVAGDPPRPVPQAALEKAWFDGEKYDQEILSVFDENRDAQITSAELLLNTTEKTALITKRLQTQGFENPRIQAEIQPYSINHTVTHGEWATSDCQTCHSDQSRIIEPMQLASYTPGGVLPDFVQNSKLVINGEIFTNEEGSLYYQPNAAASGLYIFGSNRVAWIDLLGSLAFVGVLLGITAHGGLRFVSSLRQHHHTPRLKRVYMYTIYERLWHWLQTFTIIFLLFTGLIIHRPDTFGIFSFKYVVQVHNILAAILLINAGLSLFYHLASGEIKQYIPRIGGFFDQAIVQAMFYAKGIFKGDPHPFEKTPQKKLNPLQQVTYFGILNVLLPLQIITGILMWGVQRFPDLADSLGGLPFLAPFHALIAWLFAAFIVAHVYLTTTGHEPAAGIRAMVTGWDEVEVSPTESAENQTETVLLEDELLSQEDNNHGDSNGNETEQTQTQSE